MLTLVKLETELILNNGVEYEVKAIVSHWGNTIREGHYVSYLKNETGQWWLLNDSSATLTSLSEANTRDNYVMLLERKLRLQDAQESVASSSRESSHSPVMLTVNKEY